MNKIASSHHILAINYDGTVVAWGDNQFGQCNVPDGLNDVVSIVCGDFHSLALKSDGTVVAWGWNRYDECDVPSNLIIYDENTSYILK